MHRELNISFAVLGKEECGTCAKLVNKPADLEAHRRLYTLRQEEYKRDEALPEHGTEYYTIDMQKVIMLPR